MIYHALINALSAHMIHINLNIFYTHVEHSATQTIHTKHHTKRQTTFFTTNATICLIVVV